MKYLKILGYGVGAFLAPSLSNWAAANMGGQHVPFTFGTIMAPGLPAALLALAALFTQKPNVPQQPK